ncbi:MAG: LysR family transcriptional regulator [Acidobacteriota bacterium]|jgi:DNA-binding transcriptional LysR family regulator|nr:LysR family transcriptional regulator [Acidobacteriota bacterium]
MELRHLRYFVVVAEQLHFRHAAEIVRVAQPALSRQIRQLEEELGVALLERSRHQVRLTPAGKAFYERAQRILAEAGRAVAEARDVERGASGVIRVGFVSTAAIQVLPDAMKKLRRQAPAAEFELNELAAGEQIDGLYRERLDIAFVHAKLSQDVLRTRVVARDRLVAAVPEPSKLASGRHVDMKDLVEWPAIMPAAHSTSGFFEQVRMAYQMAGVRPERVHYTRLLQTGLLLVAAGVGVSLVPESFQAIHVKGVAYRRLQIAPPLSELVAAWRRDNASPLLRRFVADLPTPPTATATAPPKHPPA